MSSNAEAAFSPEIDLVAMAEGQQGAPEGAAQAVMTAEPEAAAPAADAAESSVTFDQLDARRQSVAGGCGAGACGACVNRCGAYNPDDSGEDIDLVREAEEPTKPDEDGFRSRIQYTGEEARQRMAELKAAKAAKAAEAAEAAKSKPDESERPTPEQRDQMIDIRKTAADPDKVKENLNQGFARMAERQRERADRMEAERAARKQPAVEQPAAEVSKPPKPEAARPQAAETDSSVRQAQAERASRVPEEAQASRQPAKPAETETPKPKAEEPALTAQTKPEAEAGDSESSAVRTNENEGQKHSDQIHAQTASTRSYEEPSQAQNGQKSPGHTETAGSNTIVEETPDRNSKVTSKPAKHSKVSTSSGSTQSSSSVRITRVERTEQPRPKSGSTATSGELIETAESAPKAANEFHDVHSEADLPPVEEVRDDISEPTTERHDSDFEDIGTVHPEIVSAADSKAFHEFRLAAPAPEAAAATVVTPENTTTDSSTENMVITSETDQDMLEPETGAAEEADPSDARSKDRKNQTAIKKPAGTSKNESPAPNKAETEARRRTAEALSGSKAIEIDRTDEPDEDESNAELLQERLNYVIVYRQEPVKKYSGGGGEIEDVWKTSPVRRGKKSLPRTFKRIRSSSPATRSGKRNKKKFRSLLNALGRFVVKSFNSKQDELDEGAKA